MDRSHIFPRYKILCCQGDRLLLYRRFCFYTGSLASGNVDCRIATIGVGILLKMLSLFRLAVRLLRLEPRVACALADGVYVVAFLRKIWVINSKTRVIRAAEIPLGWSDPLSFCQYQNCAIWGDYGNNPARRGPSIHRIDKDGKMTSVYTFPDNTVRHIHSVRYDHYKQLFWIFTGDTEKMAGIYTADEEWKKVSPFMVGDQRFRAVVGFPTIEGIVYATDAVEEQNYIYAIDYATKSVIWETPISGSCIYGTEKATFYIFATTVEPQEGKGVWGMFSYQLGKGIHDRFSYLLQIEKESLNCKCLDQYEKDIFPMKLFGYGAVTFPSSDIESPLLLAYPVSCKKADGINICYY